MNAKTATTRTRRPSVATQNARLAEAGIDGTVLTPKARIVAFDALAADAPTAEPDGGKGERSDSPAHRQNAKPKTATPDPAAKPTPEPKTRVSKPAPAPANFPLCGCGCGVPTVTAKARFLSGHDARFAGRVGRGEDVLAADDPRLALITPALQAKIDKIRETAARKDAVKAARLAAKDAAAKAHADALAAAGL